MKSEISEMRRFWLQMFAEGDDGDGGSEGDDGNGAGSGDGNGDDGDNGSGGGDGGGKDAGKDGDKKPRSYNDADVDRIVAKHKAEWEKQHAKDVEDAQKEAAKLAKMNKEQKEQYEQEKKDKLIEQQRAEIEKLKAEANRAELSKTAAQIMKTDHEIVATQDMLDFVVADDAEATKKNISKLVGIILDDRKAQNEKRARGTTPEDFGRNKDKSNDPFEAKMNKYKRND